MIGTHTDKEHLHNHIIFNSTSFKTLKKFRVNKNLEENYTKEKIKERINLDNSLKNKFDKIKNEKIKNIYSDVDLVEPKEVLKSQITWREKLKYCIDYFVFKSKNYEEFLQGMQDVGYTISFGKHIAFRCKGMDKNIRAKVLGEQYTEEKIKENILKENKILLKIRVIKN